MKIATSDYFGSEPGDIIYDHCGLTICVRDGEEFSKYFVYDGDGGLLTSDNAESLDCACQLAENWVQAFHVDDEFCAENAGYEPNKIKYHGYTIRLDESVSGHSTYSILDNKGTILATNTLTYEEVAQACAEAWIRRHCLKKSV